jgi:predicted ATPase/DNA-binding winged helix-turn-helix (wHTH) protein
MHAASEAPAGIAFGRFLLLPHRRELLADGRPVRLGGRAFDVLMALIEARGAVVSKNALMARVWPERIVEENNLQWQISALRAAFGADRNLIRTVSGRGYQFTAEIDTVFGSPHADAGTAIAAAPPELPPTNPPEPISELVGRDEVLGEVLSLAAAHRLVTLTGAGGIGKTRLALAAARRLLPQFADGVWMAEFSPLADAGLVPTTVASALGLELGGEASARRVSQALTGRRLLLVLDTCEHVIEAAAAMAEALLGAGSRLQIIATSREPLRAEGEWVYHVPALAVPAADLGEADDFLRYGAVQLFVERARAAEPHFSPDRRVAATIAAICRRLDGLPLSIELAAARSAMLGIEQVAARLDDRFHILTGGRRTALPRQQTLRATLDWSYELLPEPERVILRRLAIFAGAFGLGAAGSVAAGPDRAEAQVIDGLFSLVAKSLVAAEAEDVPRRFRLLDTTRAYALQKLCESGEREWLARRHAEYYRALFERAQTERELQPAADWLAEHRGRIDDLRAALRWAFSPSGDASIGVRLAGAAVPLWLDMSLLTECRAWMEAALGVMHDAPCDPRLEMVLQTALGFSLMYTSGAVPGTGAAWDRALELAGQLNDVEYSLRILRGLWAYCMNTRDYQRALALAGQFRDLAARQPNPVDRPIGDRMIGFVLHFQGEQAGARQHLEHMLAHYKTPAPRSDTYRFQFDQRIMAQITLARVIWLQGCTDQAMRLAIKSVAEARAADHALTLCQALGQAAAPIALEIGELRSAERWAAELVEHSAQHSLAVWQARGSCWRGAARIRLGDFAGGVEEIRTALDYLRNIKSGLGYPEFLGLLAEGMGRLGMSEAMSVIDQALNPSTKSKEQWCVPELLRQKGELLLLADRAGVAGAEDHFRRSLRLAHQQGALFWELRTAMSLTRLLRDQGRSADAMALLQPIHDRFTEGFDTADLKMAKALLNALR